MPEVKVSAAEPQTDEEARDISTIGPLPGLSDEEFMELCKSVVVVIPHRHREGINVGICMHFGMWGRIQLAWANYRDDHGGWIETQRNGMAKWFLQFAFKNPEIKYCVMIDNDQSISWDAPLQLARHGLPIVSGVVCGYTHERGIFACFTAKDENGVTRFPSFRDTKFLPAEGVKEVEQVGTGLICIRRDVLETIAENDEEPFTIPEEFKRGGVVKKAEDIIFCERAKRYGFTTHVDFAVHAMHYKTIPINWPAECVDESVDAIQWSPSVFDYKGVA
jgi:hypothetical protein